MNPEPMLTLTIKIIQKPEGIFWTANPCAQKQATSLEIKAAKAMLIGVEESMKLLAKNLDCPLTLMEIDDPRNKP